MYTVPLKEILQMTVMEPHESLKERGELVSFEKGMGSAAFVSHQWVGENSPDPDFRQMSVLQDAIRCLLSRQKRIYHDIHAEMFLNASGRCTSALNSKPLFFWYDYFSCPQLEKNCDFHKAVDSIPGYIGRCEFFFVLVPVIDNPSLCKVFTPSSWSERGWCLVEKLFRQLSHDSSWIVIKSATQFELVSHMGFSGGSPGEGTFSEAGDKARIAPIMQKSLQMKLRLLLEDQDLVGYRVLLNLQPVLLRGMRVQPLYKILPADQSDLSLIPDPASHEVAEFLLQNGFQTIFDVDAAGWSPVHYAALRGEPLLMQGLLELHADPCRLTKKGNPSHGGMAGIGALDLCLRHRNNEAARLLLAAKAAADGRWELVSASLGDNAEGIRLLCQNRCDPLGKDPLGTSAISIACMFDSARAFEEILAEASGQALAASTLAESIHAASVFQGSAHIIQGLIDLRADVNDQKEVKTMSPFGLIVSWHGLLHRLGRVTPLTTLCYHMQGSTPLMAAVLSGHYECAAILVAAGARSDLRNRQGWSASDFARNQAIPDFLVQALRGQPRDCEVVASFALRGGYVEEHF
ncbi:ANKRD50 [Symbiodinium sp. CCMP2456]|nr:ANKRD50 [Symbiodinium sp. CCMP2456]